MFRESFICVFILCVSKLKVTAMLCLFVLFRRYLTRELIWHSQSSIRPSKIVFFLFENLERASVSLLVLSAKQGTLFLTRPQGSNPGPPALDGRTLPLGYQGGLLYPYYLFEPATLIFRNVMYNHVLWVISLTLIQYFLVYLTVL